MSDALLRFVITYRKVILRTIYNDKIKGFNVARKEAGETQNQIRKLCGKGYLDSQKTQRWVEEYEEVVRGVNGYIRYIREKKGARR